MTTSSRECFFKVSGDFLTQHARDLVNEGDWQAGLRLLSKNVVGLGHDNAIEILKGRKRLTGVNTVTLEDELKKVSRKWQKRLNWLFCGIVRERKGVVRYWRPYAVVTSWCEEDLPEVNMANPWHKSGAFRSIPTSCSIDGNMRLSAWGMARCVHYMDDRDNDRAVKVNYRNETACVLWKQVDAPPMWMTPCKDFQSGLDQWLAVFEKLPERGGHLLKSRLDREFMANPRKSPLDALMQQPNAANAFGNVTPKTAATIVNSLETTVIDAIMREPDLDSPVVAGDVSNDFGYIVKDGTFYVCRYFEHRFMACRILRQIYGREPKSIAVCDEELESLGVVRVTVSQIDGKPMMFLPVGKRLTAAQEKSAIDWCVAHKVQPSEFHFMREEEP